MHCAVLVLLRTDPAKVRLATTGRTPKEVPSLDEDWENYTQLLLSIQPQLEQEFANGYAKDPFFNGWWTSFQVSELLFRLDLLRFLESLGALKVDTYFSLLFAVASRFAGCLVPLWHSTWPIFTMILSIFMLSLKITSIYIIMWPTIYGTRWCYKMIITNELLQLLSWVGSFKTFTKSWIDKHQQHLFQIGLS